MRQIPVSKLKPGMVTAEDILSYDLKMIVPRGVILTENIISRLEGFSIYYAYIEDLIVVDLSQPIAEPPFHMPEDSALEPEPIDTDDSAKTSKDKIRESRQFQLFSHDFSKCADHYRDNIMNAIYRNEQFHANDLIKETMDLLCMDGGKISVFDMLLNMHNIDDSVYNHCIDVALVSNILARWLDFSEADQLMATACGLFHDVGKFLLPSGVLRKPGKLTADEFEIVKTHTTEGFHLLGKFQNIPETVKNSALMHHEKCDGSGYPYGLKGDEIDKFAKIVTIADIFDAMTSERVYRSAMCPFTVIKYFEDDGLQKYELKYILTFLENVANSYLNHRVTLSNGMEGNVIFINRDKYSKPVIRTENDEIIDLQAQYYSSMLQLSGKDNLSIESII